MNVIYPTHYTISSGYGTNKFQLVSFDNALIDAGISNYNLVRVSSILPAECRKVDTVNLKYGSILHTAYGAYSSNILGETIASAVSIAIPQKQTDIGIIMEYSGACSRKEAQEIVEAMAEESMGNHSIIIKSIICSSIQRTILNNDYTTVISAVSMW